MSRTARVFLCLLLGLLSAASSLVAQAPPGLYVATYLEVQPASVRQGAELATRYANAARMQQGNVRAQALQELGQTHRFIIIEAWADQASFALQSKAAHTVEFQERLKPIQRSPYDQRLHSGFAIDPMPLDGGTNAVYVVTHVDVPGNRREEAEVLLRRLQESSLKDAGHLRYDVYQQVAPRTNHFKVFAGWNSRSAFDAYGGTAHWRQFREALGPMLGALYDERLYQAIR
jgi:quinol monooxygenase YgiN